MNVDIRNGAGPVHHRTGLNCINSLLIFYTIGCGNDSNSIYSFVGSGNKDKNGSLSIFNPVSICAQRIDIFKIMAMVKNLRFIKRNLIRVQCNSIPQTPPFHS